MYDDIILLLNDEKYNDAKELIVNKLKEKDNPDLWYLLFLAENNNYLDFDPNNINNTYAYNQATNSDNENYELEFKLYKELANMGLNKLFRLIQIGKYEEAEELLKVKKTFIFKLSLMSTAYLNEIIYVNDEIKINYYLKFIDYIYEGSNNEQTKKIKDKFYGYYEKKGFKKIDAINNKTITKNENTKIIQLTGDNKLYFGRYPQKKVEDNALISKLNTLAGALPKPSKLGNWKDYGYYIKKKKSSYMYYIDIDIDNDGIYDYRGVCFIKYRPSSTIDSSSSKKAHQNFNGYNIHTLYWFKYEPIKWNILKEENGKTLIISDLILDSQDYYNSRDSRTGATDYQGNTTTNTVHPNNYMYSNIRNWLNTTFYDTSFNDLEKEIIETTLIDNRASTTSSSTDEYICDNTNDKLFLLSYAEANSYYTNDILRQTQGTDYAKCQGLWVNASNGNSSWWLRSPDDFIDYYASYVNNVGGMIDFNVYNTYLGVRAACWIKL